MLVIIPIELRTNQGEIERENKPNFRPTAGGVARETSDQCRENFSQ